MIEMPINDIFTLQFHCLTVY